MKTSLVTILIFLICFPVFIVGQTNQEANSKKEPEKKGQDFLGAISFDPSLSSNSSGKNIQLILETTKLDAKRAKAQIGFQQGDSIFSIKIEGPVGAKADPTTWADLNGLANSVVADIGFCNYIWHPRGSIEDAINQYHKDLLAQGMTETEYQELLEKVHGFNSDNIPYKYIKNLFGTPLQWGMRFKIGREKFSYLDSVNYDEKDKVKTNFAIVWFYGIVLPASSLYLGLSYRYESAFKAGDAQKISVPIKDVPGALRSYELPIEEPKSKIGSIGQFEARYFVSPQFALNPKIAYDFKANALGIEIPFYFLTNTGKDLKNQEQGLNGGISFGWRSDTKDLGIALFVGNVFNIFRD